MRVGAWLTVAAIAAGIAFALWYMVAMPGRSWSSSPSPVSDDERALGARLRTHVATLASGERNVFTPERLEAAARYVETTLAASGYAVRREEYPSDTLRVRNLIVEIAGGARAGEIVVVGAHYDSVMGSPGANDNGSGAAAVIELARSLREWTPARTWRLALFVNEEPPFFESGEMGSAVHARAARARGERIVAMYSIETIGYFSDRPGSQHYPFPLGLFYPDRGDFLAFVANLGSRALLHKTIAAFRAHAAFPSEGVAAPAFIPGIDWSDHRSFWREGYPAMMVTDTAPYRDPNYHSSRDTPDKLDYERLARVTRALERMFRELDSAL